MEKNCFLPFSTFLECSSGHKYDPAGGCVLCVEGTYSSDGLECQNCPLGTDSLASGSSSCGK